MNSTTQQRPHTDSTVVFVPQTWPPAVTVDLPEYKLSSHTLVVNKSKLREGTTPLQSNLFTVFCDKMIR